MLFSSPRFFFFLAAVLAMLALPFRNVLKLRLLTVASCIFYASWDYRYLALLIAISAIDYQAARQISASQSERGRQFWVTFSVASNLGILSYFKYANFFLDNLNRVAGQPLLPAMQILLPAGISFYTFKTMSYTIDVYRRRIAPVRSLLDYTTFVTFFPELIAGPIVRASVFLPQMGRPVGPTPDRLAAGASLFLLGLSKKVLLADRVATFADPVFADPTLYSCTTVWCGVLAYTLQIYCDFSGYSDMAIGTAKMIGYDLPENFDLPYASGSVTEFWRRWHMTLSEWLRDYLYIPLGGNRRGTARTYLNLVLTMLLGGLWHGSSWNFVLWGALHGGALAAHRVYASWRGRWRMPRALGIACTFLFVMLCWIPFRAPTLGATAAVLQRMVGVTPGGAVWLPYPLFLCATVMLAGHIVGSALRPSELPNRVEAVTLTALAVFDIRRISDPISGWRLQLGLQKLAGAYLIWLWILTIFFFAATTSNPFIYFQF